MTESWIEKNGSETNAESVVSLDAVIRRLPGPAPWLRAKGASTVVLTSGTIRPPGDPPTRQARSPATQPFRE